MEPQTEILPIRFSLLTREIMFQRDISCYGLFFSLFKGLFIILESFFSNSPHFCFKVFYTKILDYRRNSYISIGYLVVIVERMNNEIWIDDWIWLGVVVNISMFTVPNDNQELNRACENCLINSKPNCAKCQLN